MSLQAKKEAQTSISPGVFVGAVGATARTVDVAELEAGPGAGAPYCATAAARAGKRKRANGFVNMLKS